MRAQGRPGAALRARIVKRCAGSPNVRTRWTWGAEGCGGEHGLEGAEREGVLCAAELATLVPLTLPRGNEPDPICTQGPAGSSCRGRV